MKLSLPRLLDLCALLAMCLANIRMDPRRNHPSEGIWSVPLPKEEAHAVFYRSENNSLYIGGVETLYHFNLDMMLYKNYTIETESSHCLEKSYCKNYVTYVGQLLGKLTVCGTNAHNPCCWAMDGDKFHRLKNSWAEQLAPPTPVTNYNILITENQVYSTLPRRSNNGVSLMKTSFRKISGDNPLLYTGDKFLRQPEIVKSLIVEKEDKVQNKILLFFTEDSTENRTLDRRLTMVAQLCKEETGSAKANTRNIFSTALKSRMICGNQLTEQYYPHLQDIYFLQGETGNVIYGLFKNSWNHSAVCSYEVKDIEQLFNTSSLFGSTKNNLKIRPGTCLPPRTYTPEETSEEASSYPELTQWLWPSGKRTVIQNLHNYRKIVVDEIATMNQTYRVLILATDDGTVHKVVELEDGAFNILKVTPFKEKGQLQFMELVPNEHVLYIGTTHEIARLSLDDCAAYSDSCTECITSRDPYCGWTDGKCESVLKYTSSLIQQNLNQNATCSFEKESPTQYLEGAEPGSPNEVVHRIKYTFSEGNSATKIQCMWILVFIIQLLM